MVAMTSSCHHLGEALEASVNRRRDAFTGRRILREITSPPSAALTLFPVASAGLLGGLAVAYGNSFSAWAVGAALFVMCISLGLWANKRYQARWHSLQDPIAPSTVMSSALAVDSGLAGVCLNVLPIWSRQIEAARLISETSILKLSERFGTLASNISHSVSGSSGQDASRQRY